MPPPPRARDVAPDPCAPSSGRVETSGYVACDPPAPPAVRVDAGPLAGPLAGPTADVALAGYYLARAFASALRGASEARAARLLTAHQGALAACAHLIAAIASEER